MNPLSLWAWNPSTDGSVETLAVDTNLVHLGGGIKVNSKTRDRLARLDKTTGALDTKGTPGADDWVLDFLADGSTLCVGGNFITIGRQSRTGLAALNDNTGAVK